MDARLREHASHRREYASYLECLVGKLQVPSYRQWRDVMEAANYEYIEDELATNPMTWDEIMAGGKREEPEEEPDWF